MKWLYQGTIDHVSNYPLEEKWEFAFSCQKLYLLAKKFESPDLKNLAMDQFRQGCFQASLVPGAEETITVYQHTPLQSPFRRLVADLAARQIMDPDNETDGTNYRAAFAADADFAMDVIRAIKQGVGGILFPDPTIQSGCQYHAHSHGEVCNS